MSKTPLGQNTEVKILFVFLCYQAIDGGIRGSCILKGNNSVERPNGELKRQRVFYVVK